MTRLNPARPIWPWLAAALLLGGGYVYYRARTLGPSDGRTSVPPNHRPTSPRPAQSQKNGLPRIAEGENETVLPSAAAGAGDTAPILARLAALTVTPNQPHSLRELILDLERLRALGPAALPAIGEFLAGGHDVDYDTGTTRTGLRDSKVPTDFAVPPSLRLGLLEVVKNMGGSEAEALLLRELKTTGRGVEVAYLAGALQQLSPDKYAADSAAAARDLLAMPLSANARSPLDRSEREYLYQVLSAAKDPSHVQLAQAQWLLPAGQIDRGALRYLQQTLGEESVRFAAQAWNDPRVSPQQKEPLARLALGYVGASARAEELYRIALKEPALSDSARKNLIEDLNQDGFANPKQLTAADLPLIQKRLALIEELAPQAKDRTSIDAFAEAKKDLIAMRNGLLGTTTPKK